MSAAYSTASTAFVEQTPEVTSFLWPHRTSIASQECETDLVLRNAGSKPLRMRAELLAEGSNRTNGSSMWHEVSLYKAADGQFAVALRLVRVASAESGVHRARVFDTMDEAASWLEQFDPTSDLTADFDVSDTNLSAVSVALKAAALRDRAEQLDRAYRGLVCEVLFRLETEA